MKNTIVSQILSIVTLLVFSYSTVVAQQPVSEQAWTNEGGYNEYKFRNRR